MDVISQIAGIVIILIALGDIFLTVLQRGSTSIISGHLNRFTWLTFRRISGLKHIIRDRILSYAGPTLLTMTVLTWASLLILGFALVYWPAIGTSIQASDGPTPPGFWTALYFSAMSLSTLGAGDIMAVTHPFRLLSTLEALLGFSVLTAALTYMMSIFSALISHNSFALALHHASGDKGNAAELVARFGAGGDFSGSRQEIGSLGTDLISVIESHHTYIVLRYFRLSGIAYALPRIAILTMDTASLMRSALDENQYRSLVNSTAVAQLWGGGTQLLTELGESFLPKSASSADEPTREEVAQWRKHYHHALDRFQREGIAVTCDVQDGEDRYVEMRREWQPKASAFVDYLAYTPDDISPDEHHERSPEREK